jgi:hypothetical protein
VVRLRLRDHPFLTLGAASFLLLLALMVAEPPEPAARALGLLWRTLGSGPHLAANLLARHAPALPDWLDAALVVVLGLLPYAAADALLRRWRAARSGRT